MLGRDREAQMNAFRAPFDNGIIKALD